jgi:nucleotide-binding universal stress UspA family protein
MLIKTVLGLTDLGVDSLSGLRAAYALAARHGAKLVVGHVLVPRTLDASNVTEFLAEHGLDTEVAMVEIEVDADVHSGIDLILERAKPDLVVLSSQRKRGVWRLLWASVPVGLVGDVQSDVLALHAGRDQDRFSRALVCVDGSPQAQRLLDHAATLLEENGEAVALMVIEDSPLVIGGVDIGLYNEQVLKQADEASEKFLRGLRLSRPDLSMKMDHRVGNAVAEIKKARVEHDADLVVIGSGGIGGRAQFFIGKVAESVVRYADVPVLVVPTERPDSGD